MNKSKGFVSCVQANSVPVEGSFYWQQRILKRLLSWEDQHWQSTLGQLISGWQDGQPQHDVVSNELMSEYFGFDSDKRMAKKMLGVLHRVRSRTQSRR